MRIFYEKAIAGTALATAAAIGVMLGGCSEAKLVSSNDVALAAAAPTIVHVADFTLAPDSLKSEDLFADSPLHTYLEEKKARALVGTMSSAIIADLKKKGIAADRLSANAALPPQGWLVRGTFLRIDEGNRLRRSIIGFGTGRTDLEVATTIDDLTIGAAPAPLYRAQTDAASAKAPGAVVTFNPYAAAAKFVLAGRDLDRNTRETAEKIAALIATKVKAARGRDAPSAVVASP